MILSMILGALHFANSRRQYSGVIIRRSDRDIRQSSFSQDSFQEHSLTFFNSENQEILVLMCMV